MNCSRTQKMVDAWIDQELDAQTADALSLHIAGCSACAIVKRDRENARALVRKLALRHRAPPGFREEVLRKLHRADVSPGRVVSLWKAWSMALTGAAVGVVATFLFLRVPIHDRTPERAVASHVAALASGIMLHVASQDRHTIKPWFQGKIEFAPPVRELTADGFTLLGARLDKIGSQPAASIVYRIRNHSIDLYVWPGDVGQQSPLQLKIYRGFGIVYWSGNGLHFAAVSDVDPRDLERFALLIRSP